MILRIDTAAYNTITLSLREKGREVVSCSSAVGRAQAEKLLPLVEKLLSEAGLTLSQLSGIEVAAAGQGFSSLRIGVATANALAYALGIPVVPTQGRALKKKGIAVAAPAYEREPSIG